jgi:hypothetical protein
MAALPPFPTCSTQVKSLTLPPYFSLNLASYAELEFVLNRIDFSPNR